MYIIQRAISNKFTKYSGLFGLWEVYIIQRAITNKFTIYSGLFGLWGGLYNTKSYN